MPTSLTFAKVDLALSWLFVNSLDQTDAKHQHSYTFTDKFTDGAAIDQAEVVWWDENSASGTTSYDLAGGLTDAFGNTLTMNRLKGMYLENRSTAVGEILRITCPTADGIPLVVASAADSYINVNPGGVFFWWDPSLAGVPIGAGATDQVDIVAVSGTITYRIGFIGTES